MILKDVSVMLVSVEASKTEFALQQIYKSDFIFCIKCCDQALASIFGSRTKSLAVLTLVMAL